MHVYSAIVFPTEPSEATGLKTIARCGRSQRWQIRLPQGRRVSAEWCTPSPVHSVKGWHCHCLHLYFLLSKKLWWTRSFWQLIFMQNENSWWYIEEKFAYKTENLRVKTTASKITWCWCGVKKMHLFEDMEYLNNNTADIWAFLAENEDKRPSFCLNGSKPVSYNTLQHVKKKHGQRQVWPYDGPLHVWPLLQRMQSYKGVSNVDHRWIKDEIQVRCE